MLQMSKNMLSNYTHMVVFYISDISIVKIDYYNGEWVIPVSNSPPSGI